MATKGTKSAKSSKSAASSKSAKSAASKSSKSLEAPPRQTEGVDLQAIESELNSDAAAQAAFLKNPTQYLQSQGLKLRAGDKTELKNLVREMTSGPRLAEGSDAGSSLGISIRIRRWIRA